MFSPGREAARGGATEGLLARRTLRPFRHSLLRLLLRLLPARAPGSAAETAAPPSALLAVRGTAVPTLLDKAADALTPAPLSKLTAAAPLQCISSMRVKSPTLLCRGRLNSWLLFPEPCSMLDKT